MVGGGLRRGLVPRSRAVYREGGPLHRRRRLATVARSPFRYGGYVPAADGRSFVPVRDVRASLRQNDLEPASLARVYLGETGAFVNLEAAFVRYWRGLFSDAELYPGFERDSGGFFGPVLLPEDEYCPSVAPRARIGIGYAW